MKIAHVSDLHFGRIAFPGIVEALLRDIHEAEVALVVVSGDLTQRALPGQFRAACDLLDAFVPPVLVVPGNHDVFPWWRPGRRILNPLARYKAHLEKYRRDQWMMHDIALLGINSAHGRTIKGGKIEPHTVRRVRTFFSESDPEAFKILALHHHLVELPGLMPHDVSVGGAALFDDLCQVGVQLILCGHIHVSHVESLPCNSGKEIVVASAGTATSDRGRREHKGRNYYNIIDIKPTDFTIEERRYSPEERTYETERKTIFER